MIPKLYNRMVNIQWYHNKISPKLSIFTPKFSKISWGSMPPDPPRIQSGSGLSPDFCVLDCTEETFGLGYTQPILPRHHEDIVKLVLG